MQKIQKPPIAERPADPADQVEEPNQKGCEQRLFCGARHVLRAIVASFELVKVIALALEQVVGALQLTTEPTLSLL